MYIRSESELVEWMRVSHLFGDVDIGVDVLSNWLCSVTYGARLLEVA